MPHPIHIDEEQNRAIRDELGARLRMIHQLEGNRGSRVAFENP